MIFVTGASTGIGHAAVKDLIKKNQRVLASVRKQEDAEKLYAEFGRELLKCTFLEMQDRESIEAVTQTLTELEAQGWVLQGLVNNAGVVVAGPIEFVSVDRVRELFEINFFGLMRLTQVCLPFLRKSKGRIVNISSIAGRTVTPILSPYCASKHCVEVISDALRVELEDAGVLVILIEPGSIKTPIWQKSLSENLFDFSAYPPSARKFYGAVIDKFSSLAKKLGENGIPPEEVAAKVAEALFSKRPATRYLVGRDAKLSLLQNLLPDRIKDKMIRSYLFNKNSGNPKH